MTSYYDEACILGFCQIEDCSDCAELDAYSDEEEEDMDESWSQEEEEEEDTDEDQ